MFMQDPQRTLPLATLNCSSETLKDALQCGHWVSLSVGIALKHPFIELDK